MLAGRWHEPAFAAGGVRCAYDRAVDRSRILVVAATVIELEWVVGVESLAVGVGPVEAALGTARRLAVDPPALVLHVGIAGAKTASGIAIGEVVIGTESRYTDLNAEIPGLVKVCQPAADLLAQVAALLPDARRLPIATTAFVGGGACDVEAMEGFSVLRAAARAGIPAVEVRTISNMVEEQDRRRWDFRAGLERIADVGRLLVAEL